MIIQKMEVFRSGHQRIIIQKTRLIAADMNHMMLLAFFTVILSKAFGPAMGKSKSKLVTATSARMPIFFSLWTARFVRNGCRSDHF